ncbi:dethiobiotin synthase [Dissulfurirhabdus thermomarina]|uniref:ATP-dependent dethiobiotin synthetase BioD n=1 Tax=Dissulfurirhabdus thermomarina TaxID=1765737 RepID=A0A6N9TP96_DISTH|nr:dethiobiotin synthase [Dissulfurirhabdus thermomarina]NDY43085.1 dethiobiotin synthase [Dissulfurirhabdus thermomarina]NMX22698.1 dethiobiotin synthase [Dissulfurirhabdus thermomarina]
MDTVILFVTGTDTDVGKTFVCGLLARGLAAGGLRVAVQKWVSTGGTVPADVAAAARAAGLPEPGAGSDAAPCVFSLPASPHLAAEAEGRAIDPGRLLEATRRLSARADVVILEGVGGALVPLTRSLLLADLAAELAPTTLVVARSGLGTLNHSLLTLEALARRGIPVAGLILNDQGGEDPVVSADNRRTLAALGGVAVFGPIPRVARPEAAATAAAPLVRAVRDLVEAERA